MTTREWNPRLFSMPLSAPLPGFKFQTPAQNICFDLRLKLKRCKLRSILCHYGMLIDCLYIFFTSTLLSECMFRSSPSWFQHMSVDVKIFISCFLFFIERLADPVTMEVYMESNKKLVDFSKSERYAFQAQKITRDSIYWHLYCEGHFRYLYV